MPAAQPQACNAAPLSKSIEACAGLTSNILQMQLDTCCTLQKGILWTKGGMGTSQTSNRKKCNKKGIQMG